MVGTTAAPESGEEPAARIGGVFMREGVDVEEGERMEAKGVIVGVAAGVGGAGGGKRTSEGGAQRASTCRTNSRAKQRALTV